MRPSEHQFLQNTLNVLADESRLKLIGILSLQALTLQELASSLRMKRAPATRHLRKLQHLSLIDVLAGSATSPCRYTLNLEHFRLLAASWYSLQRNATSGSEITVDAGIFDTEEREILRRFFRGSDLIALPRGRRNLAIVVKWFAHLFVVGVEYREREVNEIIRRHYHDYAFFKKDLVGRGFLRRDHSRFWRDADSPTGSPTG